jgi:hypothetical protein
MHPSVRPELTHRIVWEAEAVRGRFPDRFQFLFDDAGRPTWQGSVPIEGRDFPVIVTYPAVYPAVPPTLETTLVLPWGCPHILTRDGGRCRLCWIAPNGRSPRRRWDPQRHTAATVLRAAQRWGLALLVWQATGVWPVPDAFDV